MISDEVTPAPLKVPTDLTSFENVALLCGNICYGLSGWRMLMFLFVIFLFSAFSLIDRYASVTTNSLETIWNIRTESCLLSRFNGFFGLTGSCREVANAALCCSLCTGGLLRRALDAAGGELLNVQHGDEVEFSFVLGGAPRPMR